MVESAPHSRLELAGPLYRIVVLTVIALAVGAIASLLAVAFVDGVAWLNHAFLISPRARVQFEEAGWLVPMATIAVPAVGGLLVGLLLTRFSAEWRPLGPPDVIRAVQFRENLPDARSGAVSTVAALVSLGSGASVGQYGPMVYLGAMVGNLVARLRVAVPNLPAIAIACGVAAAISTAFNAPIAGLVFAHEVVLRHYSTQAFAPTTVASSVGYILANVVFERPALFLVDFEGVRHGYEFVLFGLLGVLAAGVAMAFMALVLRSGRIAARSGLPAALRPATTGLALGVTALWLPDVLGVGQEALRFATIEGAFGMGELLVLVVAKTVLTALCIGFGFAGGVFSPALLIGILLGAWFWTVVVATGIIATSGVAVYALCGMMALASPVIGAPLTTILIVFELTRNYDITIAAMVAVVFSNLIAHRVFGRSLFDVQLAARGVDLSAGRDQARLDALPVLNSGVQDIVEARMNEPLQAVLERLEASTWRTAFVTDDDGLFRGILESRDGVVPSGSLAENHLRSPSLAFDERTSVAAAIHALQGFVGDAIPVVEHGSGRLLGVVTEASIIQAYLDTAQTLRREENAAL
ncbi:MAG: chloride channel protein [Geminicoccaceae bacterium]